jgi:hypothetical protein
MDYKGKSGIESAQIRRPVMDLSLFVIIQGINLTTYFFITGEADPIIQQFLGHFLTSSLIFFARSLFQISMKSFTS